MERIRHIAQRGRSGVGRIHRHPTGLPIGLFVLLVAVAAIGMYFGLQRHSKHLVIAPNKNFIVLVKDDGLQHTVPTDADTVGQLLAKLHISLGADDRVEPAKDAPITGDNFLVNIYRAAPVTVVDGAKQVVGVSAAATPRGMASQVGVQVYPEDLVLSEPTENLVTQGAIGNRIIVERATPIRVSLYSGDATFTRTRAKTVGDWVKSASLKTTPDDTIKPSLDTPITEGMQINVVRNGIRTVTVEQAVSAPVQTLLDTSLSFGSQAVRQEGSPGKETLTYEVNVQHGDEVSRKLIQRIVTVQPVTRIVAKGNTVNIPADKQSVLAAAGVSSADYMYVDYIFSRESHWNSAAMSSNGYAGLGQTRPATLAGVCPNWQNDPVCQTRFFSGYAGRYGGWAGAYNFWVGHGWW